MQLYTLGLPETIQQSLSNLGTVVSGDDAFELSHVLIADISKPSLDMGFEIGRAEMVMKPILCLKKKNEHSKLSELVEKNPNLTIETYTKSDEIPSIVKGFLKTSATSAKQMNDFCCGGGCCGGEC